METVIFFQSLLCLTFNLENLGGWDVGGTFVWGQMAPQNICTVITAQSSNHLPILTALFSPFAWLLLFRQ